MIFQSIYLNNTWLWKDSGTRGVDLLADDFMAQPISNRHDPGLKHGDEEKCSLDNLLRLVCVCPAEFGVQILGECLNFNKVSRQIVRKCGGTRKKLCMLPVVGLSLVATFVFPFSSSFEFPLDIFSSSRKLKFLIEENQWKRHTDTFLYFRTSGEVSRPVHTGAHHANMTRHFWLPGSLAHASTSCSYLDNAKYTLFYIRTSKILLRLNCS